MRAAAIYRNQHGRVRVVFRAGLFLLIFGALVVPFLYLAPKAKEVHEALPPSLAALSYGYLAAQVLSCSFIATWVMTRFIDRRPFAAVGLSRHPGDVKDVALGLGLAAFLMSFVPACLAVLGYASVAPLPHPWAVMLQAIPLFVVSTAIIGINEELLFRGYFFQLLIEGMGPWWATIILSVVFGVLHYNNPNGTLLGALGTGLWGVLLSYAYIKTRSLWFPIGIHWAANFVESVVWGTPSSGHEYPVTFLATTPSGPEFITGGIFGPEASILMPIALALGLLFIYRSKQLQASERMQEYWRRHIQPRAPREEGTDEGPQQSAT